MESTHRQDKKEQLVSTTGTSSFEAKNYMVSRRDVLRLLELSAERENRSFLYRVKARVGNFRWQVSNVRSARLLEFASRLYELEPDLIPADFPKQRIFGLDENKINEWFFLASRRIAQATLSIKDELVGVLWSFLRMDEVSTSLEVALLDRKIQTTVAPQVKLSKEVLAHTAADRLVDQKREKVQERLEFLRSTRQTPNQCPRKTRRRSLSLTPAIPSSTHNANVEQVSISSKEENKNVEQSQQRVFEAKHLHENAQAALISKHAAELEAKTELLALEKDRMYNSQLVSTLRARDEEHAKTLAECEAELCEEHILCLTEKKDELLTSTKGGYLNDLNLICVHAGSTLSNSMISRILRGRLKTCFELWVSRVAYESRLQHQAFKHETALDAMKKLSAADVLTRIASRWFQDRPLRALNRWRSMIGQARKANELLVSIKIGSLPMLPVSILNDPIEKLRKERPVELPEIPNDPYSLMLSQLKLAIFQVLRTSRSMIIVIFLLLTHRRHQIHR